MRRLLPFLLALALLTAPLTVNADVALTYPPDVMHLNLQVGECYSFKLTLTNNENYALAASIALDVKGFIVSCEQSQFELGPGERRSVEITLKPLVPGDFERVIDVQFEGRGPKVRTIGVLIRGHVEAGAATPGWLPTLIVVIIAVGFLIVSYWRKREA